MLPAIEQQVFYSLLCRGYHANITHKEISMKILSIFTALCLLLIGAAADAAGGAGGAENPDAPVVERLEELVVTASREAEPLREKAQSFGIIKKEEIQDVKPTHPSEIMNRIPGVWANTTAGEGHMTAIRQPISTNPFYLFLEDGIPIRPTGFFNHNALYEVNIPGADRIEIMKGPSTALYGSDAVGGTINVLTRPAPATPEISINPEIGEFGWSRLLASGGNTWGKDGVRLDLNGTRSSGWRDRTGYDRKSGTLRWDHLLGATAKIKAVIGYSEIDQDTGGANALLKVDFLARPSFNYQTFDFRKVKAFRVSTEYEKEFGEDALLSLIPFARWNRMELLPGWGIFQAGPNFFGYNSTTEFYSLGLLAKYRHDFSFLRSRLTGGVDIDYSPGSYQERRIQAAKSGDQFVSYVFTTNTDNNFDFDATFTGISPYAQLESSPMDKLRVTVGARYDFLSYDYETRLAPNANRPADGNPSFRRLSPKVGVTYDVTKDISGYASYTQGFRVPSSGDLFRGTQGTAATAINLQPIRTESYEIGLRGGFAEVFTFNTAAYFMTKKDDIVNFSPSAGLTQRVNAGETEHNGIEIGLGIQPIREVELSSSFSYAVHRFNNFKVSTAGDFSGKEMPQAPRVIVSTRLALRPSILNGGVVEIEWVNLGDYWLDNANTEKYDGHDLFNFRASYRISKEWELYAKAVNLAGNLYAEYASKNGSSPAQFSPGQPRTFYGGLVYRWGGDK